MIVLGIETSCDETSVALLNNRKILTNLVFSQEEHLLFNGVVPEIAARAHIQMLPTLLDNVFQNTNLNWQDVELIAATCGPGLIGGVMIGATCGKALAKSLDVPFIAVNHLAGHALTPQLSNNISFPYLLLLVTGGHTQLITVYDVDRFEIHGTTIDDAVGEAFDKSAKMLGLSYPGGPEIEKLAKQGRSSIYNLPEPLMKDKASLNFSFSGLKTAVRNLITKVDINNAQVKADIAYSVQDTIKNILIKKVARAIDITAPQQLVVAGGVAANQHICAGLKELIKKKDIKLICPPIKLCTDNAAMIAWAGLEMYKKHGDDATNIYFEPRPRWPLNEVIS